MTSAPPAGPAKKAPPAVLVWPAPGQDPQHAVAALGECDLPISVAEWDPAADDGGRAALLTSVRAAREAITERAGDPDALGLIGFGLGAVAAAGLATHAKRLGIGLGPVLCVAPTWDEPDPISEVLLPGPPERVELVENPAAVAAQITRWERASDERGSPAPSE